MDRSNSVCYWTIHRVLQPPLMSVGLNAHGNRRHQSLWSSKQWTFTQLYTVSYMKKTPDVIGVGSTVVARRRQSTRLYMIAWAPDPKISIIVSIKSGIFGRSRLNSQSQYNWWKTTCQ